MFRGGSPVILSHDDLEAWIPAPPFAYAFSYATYAVILRGFGQSAPPFALAHVGPRTRSADMVQLHDSVQYWGRRATLSGSVRFSKTDTKHSKHAEAARIFHSERLITFQKNLCRSKVSKPNASADGGPESVGECYPRIRGSYICHHHVSAIAPFQG